MSKELGDFPLWAILCGFLPAVVTFWLGVGYAGTFLVYLGVTRRKIIPVKWFNLVG